MVLLFALGAYYLGLVKDALLATFRLLGWNRRSLVTGVMVFAFGSLDYYLRHDGAALVVEWDTAWSFVVRAPGIRRCSSLSLI